MKAFVIRKAGDDFSENLAQQCIDSASVFGIKPEKVDGVYSAHDELLTNRGISPFHKMKESKKNSLGIKGCFLSHFLLWERCISINEPIIIFEHDALMIRPLPNSILDSFTHIMLLDHAAYFENYQEVIDETCDIKVTTFEKINGAFGYKDMNKKHFKGSHAHLVKPLGAATLIESCKKYGFLPLDMAVNQHYTTYAIINPILARVNPICTGKNRKQHSHTT